MNSKKNGAAQRGTPIAYCAAPDGAGAISTQSKRPGRPRATGKIRRHVFLDENADKALSKLHKGQQSKWLSQVILDQFARQAHAKAYLRPVDAPVMDAAIKRMLGYQHAYVDDQGRLADRMRGISTPKGIRAEDWAEFCDVIETDATAANALVVLGRAYWSRFKARR